MKKLSEQQKEKIVQYHKEGIKCYQISRMIKICDSMVRNYLVKKKLIKPKKRNPQIFPEYKLLTDADNMEEELKTRIFK